MRTIYQRPAREPRISMFPSVHVFPKGMQLNMAATKEIGIGAKDTRWVVFWVDDKDSAWFGFQVLKDPQKHMKNVYKAPYLERAKVIKINCTRFVKDKNIMDLARKAGTTTFPLTKEKTPDGDTLYTFEIK